MTKKRITERNTYQGDSSFSSQTLQKLFIKFLFLALVIFSLATHTQAQMGIGTATPNAAAQLDVSSTSKGFLVPRMTKAERDAIATVTSASKGLLIYQTDNTPGFYYYNGSAWTSLASSSSTSGVDLTTAQSVGGLKTFTSNDGLLATSTYGSGTPFLFSSISASQAPLMMWYPKKGALRAGYAVNTEWDDANIGEASTAFGRLVMASGSGATALGTRNTASGNYSTVSGYSNIASGLSSVALGDSSMSSGVASFTMGRNDTATGMGSVAMGLFNKANGDASVAFGDRSTASGLVATAIGIKDTASGSASFAQGQECIASGDYSTAMGFLNKATQYGCVSLGVMNSSTGFFSTSMGFGSIASGGSSTAMGSQAIASGGCATSSGASTNASGFGSAAIGNGTQASGGGSVALGENTISRSLGEIAIGTFNTDYTPASTSSFTSTDRLFVIGNGTASNLRTNALIMLKNGNTTFSGTVTATVVAPTSDARLKRNIVPLKNSMEAIMKLKPVSYEKKNSLTSTDYNIKENGFIAQELQKVMPTLVVEGTDKDKLLSVNYTAIIPVLTKAIQEQQATINSLEKTAKDQQNQISELKKMVEQLLKK